MISKQSYIRFGLWFPNSVSKILFFGNCSLLTHLSSPLFPGDNTYDIYKKSSNQQGPTV